ncbi:MAG: c-type cytochrome [Rhodospirillaceae bacterium]|nr:c-type cytochrome [Rhodospirillales bacterium]
MKRIVAIAMLLVSANLAHAEEAPAAYNQCKACHKVEKGKHGIGPSLANMVGATAGTAEGFKYSDALAKTGWVWNDATLTQYITNPRAVPGSKMLFPGLKKPEDVTAVIAYLYSLTARQLTSLRWAICATQAVRGSWARAARDDCKSPDAR